MSLAKITMTGQETYLQYKNQSLFDLFVLPEGIDQDNCVDNIMLEGGEFETLYSDPEFMRAAIGTWSSKHYRTFKKWIDALNIEYEPLENYDRVEDWTDSGTEKSKNTFVDDSETKSNSTSNSSGSSTQDGHTEDQVSAFDSNDYQESEKHIINTGETHEDEVASNSKVENDSVQTNDFNKDDKNIHSGRIHGNIGVTTSQQMLQSELDIARFNIVQQITDLFLCELCICVYE